MIPKILNVSCLLGPKPPAAPPRKAQAPSSTRQREPITDSEVPLIVGQTVNWLIRKGISTDGLFRESAPATEMKELKLKYDRGQPVDLETVNNPHLVAGLLKLYFRELQTPIFFPSIFRTFKEGLSMPQNDPNRLRAFRKAIGDLSPQDQKTAAYLFNFLVKVSNHSSENQMTAGNLGICWGPTLFRTGASAAPVVQNLIDDFYDIFVLIDE